MNCFWIATTARTGSNYFCDLLFERAEIQTPKEFLNPEFLRRLNLVDDESRLLMPSLDSFLDDIGRQWRNTVQPLCIKALYSQFEPARTLPGVRESLSAHVVVMLVRRDIVAQAVSQHIARSAGHWVSGAQPRRDPETIQYDFSALDAAVERIERHNALWRRTFLVAGISFQEIVYEQLTSQPAEIVDQVIELWGVKPRAQRQAVPNPHHSQTTDLNARLIEQYRLDKMKAIFETPVPAEPSVK
jgi:LPS sulfotransferase NodH